MKTVPEGGMVSSLFDAFTFGLLYLVFDTGPKLFRASWFVVSLLTELVFLLSMRTERPVLRSRPSSLLLGLTVAAVAVAVLLPLTGFVAVLGFQALSWPLMVRLSRSSVAKEWRLSSSRPCFLTAPGHGQTDLLPRF